VAVATEQAAHMGAATGQRGTSTSHLRIVRGSCADAIDELAAPDG
jgi:hypothetical protein